jgi:hypothetical protein
MTLIASLMIVMFVFDLYLPLGIAAGNNYFSLFLIAIYMRMSERYILCISALCTIFTIAAVVIQLYLAAIISPLWVVLLNRALSVGGIWLAYFSLTAVIKKYTALEQLKQLSETIGEAIQDHEKTDE